MVTYNAENVKIAEELIKTATKMYDTHLAYNPTDRKNRNAIEEWIDNQIEIYKAVFRLSGSYYRPGDERITIVWPTVKTFLNEVDYQVFENYRKEKIKDIEPVIRQVIFDITESFYNNNMDLHCKSGMDIDKWYKNLPSPLHKILFEFPKCIYYNTSLRIYIFDPPSAKEVIQKLSTDEIEEIVECMKPKENSDDPTPLVIPCCSNTCKNYEPIYTNTTPACKKYCGVFSCSNRYPSCANYQPIYISGYGGDGNMYCHR